MFGGIRTCDRTWALFTGSSRAARGGVEEPNGLPRDERGRPKAAGAPSCRAHCRWSLPRPVFSERAGLPLGPYVSLPSVHSGSLPALKSVPELLFGGLQNLRFLGLSDGASVGPSSPRRSTGSRARRRSCPSRLAIEWSNARGRYPTNGVSGWLRSCVPSRGREPGGSVASDRFDRWPSVAPGTPRR